MIASAYDLVDSFHRGYQAGIAAGNVIAMSRMKGEGLDGPFQP
jgi:hypothetical protein